MSGPVLLLRHSLKRMRALMLAMGVLLGLFQILLIAVASALERTHAFASLGQLLPPMMRDFLGPSATTFMSFGGMVCQGYFHPIVVGATVGIAIAIATMPTSEVESGFIDLVLSRPMARHWIITRSIIVMMLCTLALLVTMVAGAWAGLGLFGPKGAGAPPLRVVLTMAGNLGLLMLAWSGVAMAVGAASRRRGVAGTFTGLLAFVGFLIDYLARAWEPARAVAWLSPFHYYNALELIMGQPVKPSDLLVLTAISALGFGLAYVIFSRRDLSR